jgi:hypothetical protein
MNEREQQMALNKRKKMVQEEINYMWERTEQAELDAHDEKMKAKLLEEFKRKQEATKIVKDQVHEAKMKAIKEYKQTREEGALINRQVKEEEERQAIKE